MWAGLVRVLQWALILAALAGAVWLGSLAVMGYLQVPAPGTPSLVGVPVPTLMLLGGIGLGLLLALVCRWLVSLTARRRARAADRRLRGAIREVCEEIVIAPVEAELAAHRDVRAGLDRALALSSADHFPSTDPPRRALSTASRRRGRPCHRPSRA